MIEIRIHGRGGQGGVTLAKLIATARFLEGQSVQAFGLYAAERSGAPIQAFCRFDAEPIRNRNLIYHPDHVVVLDPTLLGPLIATGLKAGGWILVNATQTPDELAAAFPANRLATVDATAIARRHGLGTRSVPIVNTPLAGAAARLLDMPIEHMLAALEHLGFADGNRAAAVEAFDALRVGPEPHAMAPAAAGTEATPAPEGRGPSLVAGAGATPPSLKTGQWATEQPHRQQWIPPCNDVCPAGNDVQGFVAAREEDTE
jgi:2-oxoacid:acceptor oxidoreductase gamma subunit (pyruvate/2-ketoisovalerate family)